MTQESIQTFKRSRAPTAESNQKREAHLGPEQRFGVESEHVGPEHFGHSLIAAHQVQVALRIHAAQSGTKAAELSASAREDDGNGETASGSEKSTMVQAADNRAKRKERSRQCDFFKTEDADALTMALTVHRARNATRRQN